MARGSITDLSARQKQCLRGTYNNLSAKEIGIELGLSPHTVNEHLRDARRLLGVARSMEAARMLVAAEGDKRIVPDPIGVELASLGNDVDGADRIDAARNRYNLTILQRIGIVLAIAVGAVALAGALIVGADAINRIFLGYGIDISDHPYRK